MGWVSLLTEPCRACGTAAFSVLPRHHDLTDTDSSLIPSHSQGSLSSALLCHLTQGVASCAIYTQGDPRMQHRVLTQMLLKNRSTRLLHVSQSSLITHSVFLPDSDPLLSLYILFNGAAMPLAHAKSKACQAIFSFTCYTCPQATLSSGLPF